VKQYPTPIFNDDKERAEQEAQRRAEERERKRQQVRADFPTVTAEADYWNNLFPGTRIVWAIEGDKEIGPVPPEEREAFKARQQAQTPAPAPAQRVQPSAYERALAEMNRLKETKRIKR
jgi:hypothetical protein